MFGLQDSYQQSVNSDPYAAFGQKIKNSINTPGGWLGKNSVASSVGNFLGWHPTRGNTQVAQTIPQDYPGSNQNNQNNNNNPTPQNTNVPKNTTNYKSQNYNSPNTQNYNEQMLANLRDQQTKMINSEYNAEQKRFNNLQNTTNERYKTADSQMQSDLSNLLSQLNSQQGTRMDELQNTELDRQQQSKSALDQVRNLLGDLQRKQQAYLSASGNYGSSVADAQGENFGRQAFSSLNNIQSQRDSAMRDITNKRQQVQDFYSSKISDANSNYQKQSADLKSQFMSTLDQIDQARNASAAAKKQASVDAWKEYTNNKINLDSQWQNYNIQMNQWRSYANQNIQAGSNMNPGAVANIDPTQATQKIGENFSSPNPVANQNRQTGWASSSKSLLDQLAEQFPGMNANFFNSYNDQNIGDTSPNLAQDENGNWYDANTGSYVMA